VDFLDRKIKPYLLASAQNYPVIAILGPRQSGKTTLVKMVFPDKAYISLEDPDILEFSFHDPRAFLSQYHEGAIFDEIQRAPHLLSYLQTMVDEDPIKGRFILTGSHQLMLHTAITQSLAGRINLITLLPLSIEETMPYYSDWLLDQYLYQGFYPRIYHDELNPTEVYRNYLQTYVERDVRLLINIKDLRLFEKFLRLCAGRTGQTLNYESLAGDTGVSAKTVKEWLSILEASFIIHILPPYFENVGKRLIKSPKLFFVDVGFAAYLLDLHQPAQISRDPLRGALVENFVVMETLKFYLNRGILPSLFYFRENNGAEIDLLIKQGSTLFPLEIKASKTFHESFLRHLTWFKALFKERIPHAYLLYDGVNMPRSDGLSILNWRSLPDALSQLS
jgi:predicted AAA+ superfamily ATPase